MPENLNPWPSVLLSWHGHDRGGIRVPFQQTSRPLPRVIETPLIQRLRVLANQLAHGHQSIPRWIFLVGGPGNGKSETVEDFLSSLDLELGLSGNLIKALGRAFEPDKVLKRRVEIKPDDISPGEDLFRSAIGRLIVIQDATATEDPLGDAARALTLDIADLITACEEPKPVFVLCANRGLLARAIGEASKDYGRDNEITKLLGDVVRASGLGIEGGERKQCWPLSSDPRVACWPLDLESLLGVISGGQAPAVYALNFATEQPRWEIEGRCLDCSANENCPIRQNAIWLRDSERAKALIHVLRRGELSTGQRWNFRGVFSLIAEMLVGQWQDFEPETHPCKWVHKRARELADGARPPAVESAYLMTRRLYPHALFSSILLDDIAGNLIEYTTSMQPLTQKILKLLATPTSGSKKHIRESLLARYSSLDPAIATPPTRDHILRVIEDEYSQSVVLGNSNSYVTDLANAEQTLLWLIGRAEAEWDRLGRESEQAGKICRYLRQFAAVLVKRAVGISLGHHNNEDFLNEYEHSLRNRQSLNRLTAGLQGLLGTTNFQFDLIETFGQPQAESSASVQLLGPQAGFRAEPAPVTTATSPGHDVPCFETTVTKYRIPLTFELYIALKLRQAGCTSSSIPAGVRASIDRVRHLHAGSLCRDNVKFLDQTAKIEIAEVAKIVVTDPNEPLHIEPRLQE